MSEIAEMRQIRFYPTQMGELVTIAISAFVCGLLVMFAVVLAILVSVGSAAPGLGAFSVWALGGAGYLAWLSYRNIWRIASETVFAE